MNEDTLLCKHVHFVDHPIGLRLTSMKGMVERIDLDEGYAFVRMDEPAVCFTADGSTKELHVLREAFDNLRCIDNV
jgi:hypothetical protein